MLSILLLPNKYDDIFMGQCVCPQSHCYFLSSQLQLVHVLPSLNCAAK